MKERIILFLILLGLLGTQSVFSQRVGVVLSGGGAAGLAHVGVLRALEEAEIPIDYITGSSAGALIAALYAAGISPDEIEKYVLSDSFSSLISGKPSSEEIFYLREKDIDASMFRFGFTMDSLLYKSLPTNYLTPAYLDFETLRLVGGVGASVDNDFDSLFIPFRCVASDVYNKKTIVFKDGDLNAAVRASMTFPFFVNPISLDGKLLFDGGLYNNFPADVLYEEFPVDYIIGSNVSGNDPAPSEDDIISQITTLFSHKTQFSLPCEYGMIIEPDMDIGTFEFGRVKEAIVNGYNTALESLDSIRQYVTKRVTVEEVEANRKSFKSKIIPVKVTDIKVKSRKNKDVSFVRDNFMRDTIKTPFTMDVIEKKYFRAYSSDQVKYIYPTLRKNGDSSYILNLNVDKQKPFVIRVGGHFSSRPINTGYIGLSYLDMGKGALGVHGETYFGKFYTSTKVNLNYDLPTLFPIRISPYFVLNRWDYFKSNSTFFENVKPSFLIQNETYFGVSIEASTQRNGKYGVDFRRFKNRDSYYQVKDFAEGDTADVTNFMGESFSLRYEINNLNRKEWASEGSMLKMVVRYVQGKENSLSGSTASINYDMRRWHRWVNISLEGQHYFNIAKFFKIGIYGDVVFNSKSLFSNYTAAVLTTNEFSPLPDVRTLYLEDFRAPQYIGGGADFIFNYKKSLELRISPYFFQPFRRIVKVEDGSAEYSDLFKGGLPLGGASFIYHSPLGPLRLSMNYFHKQDQPFLLQLSFGYIIFNERAIR